MDRATDWQDSKKESNFATRLFSLLLLPPRFFREWLPDTMVLQQVVPTETAYSITNPTILSLLLLLLSRVWTDFRRGLGWLSD
jgi:hypothetical protein